MIIADPAITEMNSYFGGATERIFTNKLKED